MKRRIERKIQVILKRDSHLIWLGSSKQLELLAEQICNKKGWILCNNTNTVIQHFVEDCKSANNVEEINEKLQLTIDLTGLIDLIRQLQDNKLLSCKHHNKAIAKHFLDSKGKALNNKSISKSRRNAKKTKTIRIELNLPDNLEVSDYFKDIKSLIKEIKNE